MVRLSDGPKRAAVRLSDVARRARCSAATVSRVLNAPQTVNIEARLRVEAAVRELGYMRNGAARALRSRRSHMVGLILPTLRQAVFAEFVECLQDVLVRRNYSLLVTTSDYCLEQELLQARLLAERGIDGLVLIGHTHRPELFALIQAQDLPYVTTYTFKPRLKHPVIGFDNRAAIGLLADYLLGLGHREFALLIGVHRDNDRIAERLIGLVGALAAHGVVLPQDRILREDFTIEGGRTALRRLIDSGNLPTAVICANDVVAYGVLIEARIRGIAVPSELSVTGFDDFPGSAHFDPALTTLSISSGEMGRLAGDYILSRIAGRPQADQIQIEPRLVIRETTAPPPVSDRQNRPRSCCLAEGR